MIVAFKADMKNKGQLVHHYVTYLYYLIDPDTPVFDVSSQSYAKELVPTLLFGFYFPFYLIGNSINTFLI